ncbi:Disintegrin and metalloproteinase domain-containing protein 15, partial [Armadillidium nasatum]
PKHPHFVIEAKSSHIHQKCGNKPDTDRWQRERGGGGGGGYNHLGLRGRRKKQARHRLTRDIRSSTKYVETALFLDKKFMEQRNYSRTRGMYDALQIANIADLYFKTINTRITISYLESWSGGNLIELDKRPPISMALIRFSQDHTKID